MLTHAASRKSQVTSHWNALYLFFLIKLKKKKNLMSMPELLLVLSPLKVQFGLFHCILGKRCDCVDGCTAKGHKTGLGRTTFSILKMSFFVVKATVGFLEVQCHQSRIL